MTDGERGILKPMFCRQCGNRAEGTAFCVDCGAPVQAESPWMATIAVGSSHGDSDGFDGAARYAGRHPVDGGPVPTLDTAGWKGATSADPTQQHDQIRPYIDKRPGFNSTRAVKLGAAALVFAVLVGGVATALLLLGSSKDASSYRAQAGRLVSPVLADTSKVTSAVQALSPGGDPQAAQNAIATVQNATQVAQQSLALLKPAGSQAQIAGQVNAALTSEVTWLQTASAVLASPSSPLLSQLSGIGLDAATKFQQMETNLLPGSDATFPSSTPIVLYSSAANAAAAAREQAAAAQAASTAAETQFSNQVQALLNQSTASFQSVNAFYQQLQTAAQGGYATITLAQAEQQISGIVANRTSMAAAAQAINAPTPAGSSVRDDLVAAFNASLQNDNDLANCLNQANDGDTAYIFEGCLNASASDSSAATTAKQTFLTAYNQLRASNGQPVVNPEF